MAGQAKKGIVLETSAAIALLNHLTDPRSHSPNGFTSLLKEGMRDGEALDGLFIPDHVFYELTGILPNHLPVMLDRLRQTADQPEKQRQWIEMYVAASPRGDLYRPDGAFMKSQLRTLMHYVARHPEAILPTRTGTNYVERLKAESSIPAATSAALPTDYQPDFSDAMAIYQGKFRADSLRVHAGMLYMMGLFSEDEYNQRMGREDGVHTLKQRFMRENEFIEMLSRKKLIDEAQKRQMKQEANADHNGYLTLGFLHRHAALMIRLAKSPEKLAAWQATSVPQGESDAVDLAVAPAKLLMEHYVFSGLIPEAAIVDLAAMFRFDVDGLASASPAVIRQHLHQQGFFERRVSLRDLERMDRLLQDKHFYADGAPRLSEMLQQMPERLREKKKAWREACQYPKGELLKSGFRGMPYERMFSRALLHRAMSFSEFRHLVTAAGGLNVRVDEQFVTNQQRGVMVDWGTRDDGQDGVIRLALDGFWTRAGDNIINGYYADYPIIRQDNRAYLEMPISDFLHICREQITAAGTGDSLHRALDAMLIYPTMRDVNHLRLLAKQQLGEDRLLQWEKDFSNHYARIWREEMPPYANPMTAMHANRRMMRKNLGEIATAEAASDFLRQRPDWQLWIVNHDSDLYPAENRDIRFSDTLKRMHSDKREWLHPLEQSISRQAQPCLHFLRTDQFLDTVCHSLGLPVRMAYPGVRMKQSIRDYTSKSWQEQIERPLAQAAAAGNQRRA